MARRFCHTGLFAERVDKALGTTSDILISHLRKDVESYGNPFNNIKLYLQKACANIFFDFFCSDVVHDWEADTEFETVVKLFDDIFWEINQSHPTDVLPFLAPIFHQHLGKLASMGANIRKYVIDRIITPHAYEIIFANS